MEKVWINEVVNQICSGIAEEDYDTPPVADPMWGEGYFCGFETIFAEGSKVNAKDFTDLVVTKIVPISYDPLEPYCIVTYACGCEDRISNDLVIRKACTPDHSIR